MARKEIRIFSASQNKEKKIFFLWKKENVFPLFFMNYKQL